MFILNANEPQQLATHLKQLGWLEQSEVIVTLSTPGQGNMNCVLRIETETRSFIVKQSRDYVEKYPQVAAPANRALVEGAFYNKIAAEPKVQAMMPVLLGTDMDNNLIALQDLGKSNDFTKLYNLEEQIYEGQLDQLVSYIDHLHHDFQKVYVDEELINTEMRTLNYEHIFEYPFKVENGFDLDVVQNGLQAAAMPFKKDAELKQNIARLGSLYLSKGKYLLHGDFYPGSWLKTENGIKVIDPEFCFYGLREFDLGVFLAHLYLTNQEDDTIDYVKQNYRSFKELNLTILNGFIGTEIMRRLIGLAQLPVKMELSKKVALLEFAKKLIME
jgi:5-methylthioribose kinase